MKIYQYYNPKLSDKWVDIGESADLESFCSTFTDLKLVGSGISVTYKEIIDYLNLAMINRDNSSDILRLRKAILLSCGNGRLVRIGFREEATK